MAAPAQQNANGLFVSIREFFFTIPSQNEQTWVACKASDRPLPEPMVPEKLMQEMVKDTDFAARSIYGVKTMPQSIYGSW